MSELSEVEKAAAKHWRGIGLSNGDITIRILESRHHVERLRIYRELED